MLRRNPRVCTSGSASPQNALSGGFLEGFCFPHISFRQRKDAAVLWPCGGQSCLILLVLFLHARRGPVELVVCQEPVALPGTSCLELVNIVLIRRLLSENGSLSNLKLFVGGEQFQ